MSDREARKRLHVGGQAVIDGVMMRSPAGIATAVRRPDGEIVIKSEPFVTLTRRYKLLNLPIIRGAVVLVETMIVAIKALSFSSEQAGESGGAKHSAFYMTVTVLGAFALGFLVFFYIPLKITELLGLESGFAFNLIDGLLRFLFIFLYIVIITRWKEMRRIFEYHGAEHKTIYAFESGEDLSPRSARGYPRMHPRCSTSFILIVVLVSVLVFMLLGKPETVGERILRFSLILPIAGISYEILKLSARPAVNRRLGFLFWPGIFLQRFTTSEPSDDQIEVAIAALNACLADNFLERERAIN